MVCRRPVEHIIPSQEPPTISLSPYHGSNPSPRVDLCNPSVPRTWLVVAGLWGVPASDASAPSSENRRRSRSDVATRGSPVLMRPVAQPAESHPQGPAQAYQTLVQASSGYPRGLPSNGSRDHLSVGNRRKSSGSVSNRLGSPLMQVTTPDDDVTVRRAESPNQRWKAIPEEGHASPQLLTAYPPRPERLNSRSSPTLGETTLPPGTMAADPPYAGYRRSRTPTSGYQTPTSGYATPMSLSRSQVAVSPTPDANGASPALPPLDLQAL